MTIDKYRFADRIYKAVMRALDPYLGIPAQHNDLHDVNSNDEYEYNKMQAGVHHDQKGFYNKPGEVFQLFFIQTVFFSGKIRILDTRKWNLWRIGGRFCTTESNDKKDRG